MPSLSNKTIIITGSSRGIGRAMALRFARDGANMVSKYGMTMLTMGMAQEFSEYNIAVNCLWPRTAIATAAIEFAIGDRNIFKHCRTAEILADAAHELLTTENCSITGQTLMDEDFLSERGYIDFAKYAYDPDHANELLPDFFLD